MIYFIQPLSDYAGLIALILGIFLSTANFFYRPAKLNHYRKLFLNLSIVFFGLSLNINDVISIGVRGVLVSFISIVIIISSGYVLMKILKNDKKTSELITFGTAICGGSAISATSSIINPNNKQLALATASVFILNGIAIILFPIIGHILNMTQEQFGVFCALSIHDVSSVVGAASIYGDKALELATILKLTRTLWIIPIVLILSYFYKVENSRLPIPIFILGFILASIFSTIVDVQYVTNLSVISKVLLPMALFMVGYSIKVEDIKDLGLKAITFSLSLWLISILIGLSMAYIW